MVGLSQVPMRIDVAYLKVLLLTQVLAQFVLAEKTPDGANYSREYVFVVSFRFGWRAIILTVLRFCSVQNEKLSNGYPK